MGRYLIAVLIATLPFLAVPAGAEPRATGPVVTNEETADRVESSQIFSGGGTPLTNGFFFPGTATCTNGKCEAIGPIPQVERGTNMTYTNLDEGSISNAHRIVCLHRTKRGRPKCVSAQLDSPGESTILKTKKLRPGLYPYLCSVHFGMWGIFEVVKS